MQVSATGAVSPLTYPSEHFRDAPNPGLLPLNVGASPLIERHDEHMEAKERGHESPIKAVSRLYQWREAPALTERSWSGSGLPCAYGLDCTIRKEQHLMMTKTAPPLHSMKWRLWRGCAPSLMDA
jgi:hypothetical protein